DGAGILGSGGEGRSEGLRAGVSAAGGSGVATKGMKAMLSLVLTTAAALVGAGPDKPKSKPVEFNIRVCRGDPKGSVEAKTIEVVSPPPVTTLLNLPASLFPGQKTPVPRGGVVKYAPFARRVKIPPKPIENPTAEVGFKFKASPRQDAPPL